MTIASQLTTLNNTKSAIKSAIEAKGVTVGTVPFSSYPSKISEISSGSLPAVVWNYYNNNITVSDKQVLAGVPIKAVHTSTQSYLTVTAASALPSGFTFNSDTGILSVTLGNFGPGTTTISITFNAYLQPGNVFQTTKTYTINVIGTKDTVIFVPDLGIASYSETTYPMVALYLQDLPVLATDTVSITNISSTVGATIVQQLLCRSESPEPTLALQTNVPMLLVELQIPALSTSTHTINTSYSITLTLSEVLNGVTYTSALVVKVLTPNKIPSATTGQPFIEYDTSSRPKRYFYYQSERYTKTLFNNFVVPFGVTSMTVYAIGAGGYGTGNNTSNYGHGGSGGGGTYVTINNPTPGASYAVDVGRSYNYTDAASTASTYESSGYQSQSSSFGGLITATGGYGGQAATNGNVGSFSGGTGAAGGKAGAGNEANGFDGYTGGAQRGNWWATSNVVPTATTYTGGNATGKYGGGGGASQVRLNSVNTFRVLKGGNGGLNGGNGGFSYAVTSSANKKLANGTALGKFSILPWISATSQPVYGGTIYCGGYGGFFGGGSGPTAYSGSLNTQTIIQNYSFPGASGAVVVELNY